MVNQKELLEILNKERDYEDKIAGDLMYYINYSLEDATGLSTEEKDRLKAGLSTISNESRKHYQIFTKLIEKCLEDEEIN